MSGGRRFALTADGEQVAGADRVGQRESVVVEGSRVLGGVRRTGFWRSETMADLPSLALQDWMFAVTVVLVLRYADDLTVVTWNRPRMIRLGDATDCATICRVT